jgi:hypothetical protein
MQRNLICLRVIGALALFAVAADHLYEYWVDKYSVIPTIGTLFLLNGAGAIGLGLVLLAPLGAFLPDQLARRIVSLTAAGGVVLAATTLAGLFVSESEPLFGFMEYGYRLVVDVAIVSEAVAIFALAPLALFTWRTEAGASRSPLSSPQAEQVR